MTDQKNFERIVKQIEEQERAEKQRMEIERVIKQQVEWKDYITPGALMAEELGKLGRQRHVPPLSVPEDILFDFVPDTSGERTAEAAETIAQAVTNRPPIHRDPRVWFGAGMTIAAELLVGIVLLLLNKLNC